MTAPVYQPPSRIDLANIEAFERTVVQSALRYRHVVIDCSLVVQMGPSAMHVLALAAVDADVLLVNPTQAIRIMASAYGIRVAMSGARESGSS